jgi:acyl-CoA reductase-like NAD-dependent aldehyde dehydrogenase
MTTLLSPADTLTATLTINGESVAGDNSFDVVNPATGLVFAAAPDASPAQLDAAFSAAQRAFGTWQGDEDFRRNALRNAADVLGAAVDRIVPVLTAEQGKILSESRREILGATSWLRYYADLELPREIVQDDEKVFSEKLRRPLGPVAAITPWNVPVYIGVAKVAMALRAGNTVVLKPSPFAPLSTLLVGEVLRDVFPPGVFNVISGNDQLGPLMTGHPLTRIISFTGSIPTGKRILASAAADLKRVTLELGGNDAAIVLADADPEFTAAGIFGAAFSNTGQVCVGAKRIYVAEAIYPELVEALVAEARKAKVGNGADPDTDLGPLNNLPQRNFVAELIADTLATGGKVATGGHVIDGPGYFHESTIITDVNDTSRIVAEEQFGPALPVMSFKTEDEAIARANNTEFGLAGSVWSADADHGVEVAARIEAGTVWINTHKALSPRQPFAGRKWSGQGVEGGPWGLDGFTTPQLVYRAR